MKISPAWATKTATARESYCSAGYDYRLRIGYYAATPYNPTGDYLGYGRYASFRAGATLTFDANGVPQQVRADGTYYNPITVIQFLLMHHGRMLNSGATVMPGPMAAAVAKLLEMQSDDGALRYPFDFPYHSPTTPKLYAGWVSGMTQGQALSLFARLYALTADPRYLDAGRRALNFMVIPIEQGGTRGTLKDLHPSLSDYVTFEEYVANPMTYTLNGFMYAAVGLHDWSQVPQAHGVGQAMAAEYYRESVKSLRQILPYAEVGGFSAYDLSHVTYPGRAPHFGVSYHRNHVELLTVLHVLSGDNVFKHYSDSWAYVADTACYLPKTPARSHAPRPIR